MSSPINKDYILYLISKCPPQDRLEWLQHIIKAGEEKQIKTLLHLYIEGKNNNLTSLTDVFHETFIDFATTIITETVCEKTGKIIYSVPTPKFALKYEFLKDSLQSDFLVKFLLKAKFQIRPKISIHFILNNIEHLYVIYIEAEDGQTTLVGYMLYNNEKTTLDELEILEEYKGPEYTIFKTWFK